MKTSCLNKTACKSWNTFNIGNIAETNFFGRSFSLTEGVVENIRVRIKQSRRQTVRKLSLQTCFTSYSLDKSKTFLLLF